MLCFYRKISQVSSFKVLATGKIPISKCFAKCRIRNYDLFDLSRVPFFQQSFRKMIMTFDSNVALLQLKQIPTLLAAVLNHKNTLSYDPRCRP